LTSAPKPTPSSSLSSDNKTGWSTTKTLQFTSLTNYLFLGIQRFDTQGKLICAELDIPLELDVSKLCAPQNQTTPGSKRYELIAGILYDEEDYVAILKNESIPVPHKKSNKNKDDNNDNDDEEVENWNLMETEEVIPMTETDVLEFLRGEEGGVCGTVVVYRRCDNAGLKEMNQLLSDIIISHVRGVLDSKADFYYEEEVIEEEEEED
jgi:hypothetical protein